MAMDGPENLLPTLLLATDSPAERERVERVVVGALGWRCRMVSGTDLVAEVRGEGPTLVVADPRTEGLDLPGLLAAAQMGLTLVPVVLLVPPTCAARAHDYLRAGALHLLWYGSAEPTVAQTLLGCWVALRAERQAPDAVAGPAEVEVAFTLGNDSILIPPLVNYLVSHLSRLHTFEENIQLRVGVALEEALLNAMYHGNLELDSELRQDGSDAYYRLAEVRRHEPPFQDRRLHVRLHLTAQEVTFVVRDEGPGFDPGKLPDPTDPANLERASGRGMLLIRTFMDEVTFNSRGNQITLVKRRPTTKPGS
jgi:anti-sigma regulatory factor (Ser/Thr protein kinase)